MRNIEKDSYLKSSGATDWQINGNEDCGFDGAIVIPSLAESARLFDTLASLAANPPELLERFLVLVVVNQRQDGDTADKEDNLRTLARLESESFSALRLGWVDAASPGKELPNKNGGVGLARKIGLDLALTRLKEDGLLVCLDADTLVRNDYLPAIISHFQTKSRCGIIHFIHQPAATAEGAAAIARYELFLRSYVLGLKTAGSPYGFHTVGSAMACRASAYKKIGGMNNRSAGEDFYFLQQMARTVGVDQVQGTVLYPSSRASHRVPFGTGRSISKLLGGEEGAVLFYHCDCYRILESWLKLVSSNQEKDGQWLLAEAVKISSGLAEYLDQNSVVPTWQKLQKNNKGTKLMEAFYGWFDGLKTMKLIHHLSAGQLERCQPEASVPDLLEWAGLNVVHGTEKQLELLRKLQLGDDYANRPKNLCQPCRSWATGSWI